jgi:sugar lactone lactonase YvrE
MTDAPVCVYEARNVCGEGPVWDVDEQALYWIDIIERSIFRRTESGGEVTQWSVPADIGAMALRRTGGFVAALRSGLALFDPATGAARVVLDPEPDEPQTRFNDGKCDRAGRFWVGTCHEVADPSQRRPIASLYRIDPDLTCHRMVGGVRTSNGIDWSPDGRTMYYTDTPTLRIDAFDFDPASGTPSKRRTFAHLPADVGRPDGLAVDETGHVWSAHFDGWRVTRYRPDGTIERIVMLPVQHATSCAFGGHDLRTLYITSATEDLRPEELAAQPLAGALFALRTETRGLPMSRFAG